MVQTTGFEDKQVKERLTRLGGFAPIFERVEFKFAEMRGGNEVEPGVFAMPWSQLSKEATRFYELCYADAWILPDFDWSKWGRTREAKNLLTDTNNPSPGPKLMDATPEQLAKLLTAVVRADRFCEGYLQEAFGSGLLLAIVRRARELAI